MKGELNEQSTTGELIQSGLSRRKFLTYAGAFAGAGILVTACHKDDSTANPTAGIDLGSGDIGILNYAYALEQLEAAFYTQVALMPYSGITTAEQNLLNDIRDHEIAHREFFKNALGSKAIGNLSVDFSTIDFTSRTSVLGTAKAFEDLGVSAYNGAGKLLTTPDYLLLAGKIVSVEARHAAYIRDLISPGTFADETDNNGMDTALTPSAVLATAGKYIKDSISTSNLPTS